MNQSIGTVQRMIVHLDDNGDPACHVKIDKYDGFIATAFKDSVTCKRCLRRIKRLEKFAKRQGLRK